VITFKEDESWEIAESDLLSVHDAFRADGCEEEIVVDGKLDRAEAVGEDDGNEERHLAKSANI